MTLAEQCVLVGLPAPTLEARFHPTRRWRFDLSWPEKKLAVEIDGAVYTQGRHTRGSGYERDCEKFAEAVIAGWRVIRCTTGQVQSGQALQWVERAFSEEAR